MKYAALNISYYLSLKILVFFGIALIIIKTLFLDIPAHIKIDNYITRIASFMGKPLISMLTGQSCGGRAACCLNICYIMAFMRKEAEKIVEIITKLNKNGHETFF